MRISLTAVIVAVGACLLIAGVSQAAVTTTQSATYAFKRCSTCTEVRYPTEQECRAAAYAEAERAGLTRTTGAAVYTCITRFNVIATFKANPLPPPPSVDCVVSEWGAWSDPPWLACADGMQSRSIVRTRTILTQPANGGAACPSLVETQPQTRVCPGTAILGWEHSVPPSIAGFRVVHGVDPNALISTIQISNPSLRKYIATGLPAGQRCFGLKAYDATEVESLLSTVTCKDVL